LQFHAFAARKDWKHQWEHLGHSAKLLEEYWVEDLKEPFCARLHQTEIDNLIVPATKEINELLLDLVEGVCNSPDSERLFDRLRIPLFFRQAVRQSWQRRDSSIYGRFDLGFDGETLKLLEVNYETPVMILEAAILQKLWCDDLRVAGAISEHSTQFNYLDQNLKDAFASNCRPDQTVYFSSFYSADDERACRYLQTKAEAAGLKTIYTYADRFGVNEAGNLLDEEGQQVNQLFKLYPWQIILGEEERLYKKIGKYIFAEIVESGRVKFWEPAWKILLSSKAILALLWEMAPHQKYLLETHFDDQSPDALALQTRPHVKKPLFGRNGENVSVIFPDQQEKSESTTGDYGDNLFVVQEYYPLTTYQDHKIVFDSWVIDGLPSGLAIRADQSLITGENTIFIPHYCTPN